VAKIRQEHAITKDGWSRWVYPVMDGYKLACCDCGLVHDMQFRVTDEYDRVEFRVRRNNRSTAAVRRHKPKSKGKK
jgi:hypothetical protein